MEVPVLRVKKELQLPAYATALAVLDLSIIFDPCCILQQCWILNPLSEARDRTHILMNTTSGPWSIELQQELHLQQLMLPYAFHGILCPSRLPKTITLGTSVVVKAGKWELAGNREGWGEWRSEPSSIVPFTNIGTLVKIPGGEGESLFHPPPVAVLTDFYIPVFLLKLEPSEEET